MLELVRDRDNGLLVPAGDEAALAAALVEVMQDDQLAGRLAAAARCTIESRYSFDRMVEAFTDLYLSELAARAGFSRAAGVLTQVT
jgi:glycosyltransferase involved in cell wall biosynthesis